MTEDAPREPGDLAAILEQAKAVSANLGEGIHTGFRKGMEHQNAGIIHQLINDLPGVVWSDYVSWVDYNLGLRKLTNRDVPALVAEVLALREAVDALRAGALVPGIAMVIHAWAEGWMDQISIDLSPEQIRLRKALEALAGEQKP
jgi:hypothetical protein